MDTSPSDWWNDIRGWGTFALALGGAVAALVAAAIGRFFIAGQKYAEIEAELRDVRKDINALSAWRDKVIIEHVALQLAVSSLPTRQEHQDRFDRLTAQLERMRGSRDAQIERLREEIRRDRE